MVSVPKKSSNAGRPKGKKSYIEIFRWEDVKTDEKGVKVTAFEMMPGKKPIAVYATDSTINIYHSSEGEDDARGFIHHVDYEHPGTELEHDEFVNNNINENLGAIVFGCSGEDAKIAGTPCTPLKMTKADSQDNKEGDKQVPYAEVLSVTSPRALYRLRTTKKSMPFWDWAKRRLLPVVQESDLFKG